MARFYECLRVFWCRNLRDPREQQQQQQQHRADNDFDLRTRLRWEDGVDEDFYDRSYVVMVLERVVFTTFLSISHAYDENVNELHHSIAHSNITGTYRY